MSSESSSQGPQSLIDLPISEDAPIYRSTTEPLTGRPGMMERAKLWIMGCLQWAVVLVVLSGVSLLGTAMAVALVIRWVKYGFQLLTAEFVNHIYRIYSYIDEISPSPTPEIRQEKFATLRAKLLWVMQQSVPDVGWGLLSGIDFWDTTLLVVMVVLSVSSWLIATRVLYFSGTRVIQRIRGVRFESMQSGSEFTKAPMVSSQVRILIPGLLSDTHNGYGVRFSEFLVCPYHVVKGLREVIIANGRGKLCVPIQPTISRLNPDLCFIYVGSTAFSKLSVTTAKVSAKFAATYAACFGESGTSRGRLVKSRTRGQLNYYGSTISGMSGSAYVVASGKCNIVVGVHQGAMGNGGPNLGFSASMILAELGHLTQRSMKAEAAVGASPGCKDVHVSGIYNERDSKYWDEEDLFDTMNERYEVDDWTAYEDPDYDLNLGWDTNSDDGQRDSDFYGMGWDLRETGDRAAYESKRAGVVCDPYRKFYDARRRARPTKVPAPVVSCSVTKPDGVVTTIPLNLQSPVGDNAVVDVLSASLVDYLVSLRSRDILGCMDSMDSRISRIESRLCEEESRNSLSAADETILESLRPCPVVQATGVNNKTKKKHPGYKCSSCSAQCYTQEKLENHTKSSHPVKLESAIPEDTGDVGRIVKQKGSFLGKSPSPKKSGGSYRKNSNAKKTPSVSQLLGESLLKMERSQRNIEQLLEKLPVILAGQNLATMQN